MGALRYFRFALFVTLTCRAGLGIQGQTTQMRQGQNDFANWYSNRDSSRDTVFIPFLSPLLIDENLQNASPLQANKTIRMISDPAPQSEKVVSGSSRMTYEVYEIIVRNRALETWSLTPLQTRQLKDSEHIIIKQYCVITRLIYKIRRKDPPRTASKQYRVYRVFAHNAAVLSDKITDENEPVARMQLQEQLKAYEHEWKTKGRREKVAAAITTATAVRSTDPERFWTDVETHFLLNSRQEGSMRVPTTTVLPAVKSWNDVRDWVPWHAGSTSGEVKFIAIKRDWLVDAVLGNHKWSWGPGIYKQEGVRIADGTNIPIEGKKKTLMPFLPISVVIGKGARLTNGPVMIGEPEILGLICKRLPRLPDE